MKKDYTQFSEELRTSKHDEICDRIKNTYAMKHHDYGPSFEKSYYEFGWVAAYVRMEDKMSRLKSLFEKGEDNRKVMDEKIADTVIDLANYAIMLATELELESNVKNTEIDKSILTVMRQNASLINKVDE